MKLINFPGLNCYTNGIVSILHELGREYCAVFCGLWSEADFYYQPCREVYLSKRLPDAFGALGLKFLMQVCDTPAQAAKRLSQLEEGELVILGMDAFYVPWSQFYNTFHGPHFFAARETKGDALLCYDPTFDKAGVALPRAGVIAHAYDISRIVPAERTHRPAHALSDAEEVLRAHPALRRRVADQIVRCADGPGSGADAVRLAKYIDALKNNRCLYRHYLERLSAPYNEAHGLIGDELISKWTALKNGLYKASITQSKPLFDETRALFDALIDEEQTIAERMLHLGETHKL